MKTKPILFSTEMVQAILAGRKTQTRRIIKPKPITEFFRMEFDYPPAKIRCKEEEAQSTLFRSPKTGMACFIEDAPLRYNGKGANYKVGDILWVRETWVKLHEAYLYKLIPDFDSPHFFYCYKADGEPVHFEHYGENWKPSIHMPKEAARIFLEVTDVRVERLQSISNSDALSEGIKVIEEDEAYFDYENNGEAGSYGTARGSFFSLWRKIYGDKCFDNNPFVWVYEFKRTEKPLDF